MTTAQTKLREFSGGLRLLIQGLSLEAVRSPRHWLKRQGEIATLEPRRRELEAELSRYFGRVVELVCAQSKRGSDEIYFAHIGRQRVAVVRVNRATDEAPSINLPPSELIVRLPAPQRLQREWDAYQSLSPLGLSPHAIWRSSDAVACTWLEWTRASELLIQGRTSFWPLMEIILPSIRRMHDSGIMHLDLNPGNVLMDSERRRVSFIDFEYGPASWASPAQQRVYDYLRLINDCTRPRRGGKQMLENVDRLCSLLHDCLDTATRSASVPWNLTAFARIRAHRELCDKLRTVFPDVA